MKETKENIIEALKGVEDPDLFLDVWFLGLIYDVRVNESLVEIDMTFTTPLCPSGPELVGMVKEAAESVEGVETANVQVIFDPPWKPNDEVKAMMGLL